MNTMTLANSDLNVSRLCMGCMQIGTRARGETAAALLDAFRDAGGNFFDTAHCYCFWTEWGDGISERTLGEYIKNNNCRDEVLIATKGAHPESGKYRKNPNYMSPERLAADIDDSLGRLQTDVIDLLWLHRDDPRVGVGEILDMLNAEARRGRIRHFGGSNWTARRLEEANAYAAEHGIGGFVASQPRWSLLHYDTQSDDKRLEPGVLLHVNDDDRRRHEQSQLPVIPYGPTGNGFFAYHGEKPETFVNDENVARAARADQLAEPLGATPNQVALAWLMHQPFPVVPILGTADVDHLADALGSVEVNLTDEQVAWLENG